MARIRFNSEQEKWGCLMLLSPFLGISSLAALFIGNEDGNLTSMALFGIAASVFGFFIGKHLSK
jgi:hypothetical protein